ncbi:hypothetical protein SAMN02910357_01604 [Succinivibrio dextrinosolvens]|nr:hypothetical protein SAMN02910357_01604 [Succinivibrio dextrinosolvens]
MLLKSHFVIKHKYDKCMSFLRKALVFSKDYVDLDVFLRINLGIAVLFNS